jgi:hypothetical protein
MRKRANVMWTVALRPGQRVTGQLDRELLGLVVMLALVVLGHALR